MFVRAAFSLLVVAYCVKRLASSRYIIEIDERGIFDGATGLPRVPWSRMTDLTCEANGNLGALLVRLDGAERREVRVYLDGVDVPLQTIFRSALAYWEAGRNAPKEAEAARQAVL